MYTIIFNSGKFPEIPTYLHGYLDTTIIRNLSVLVVKSMDGRTRRFSQHVESDSE